MSDWNPCEKPGAPADYNEIIPCPDADTPSCQLCFAPCGRKAGQAGKANLALAAAFGALLALAAALIAAFAVLYAANRCAPAPPAAETTAAAPQTTAAAPQTTTAPASSTVMNA